MFSFGIIAENFEVCENYIFDCKVLWMVDEGEWNSVGFFDVLGVVMMRFWAVTGSSCFVISS